MDGKEDEGERDDEEEDDDNEVDEMGERGGLVGVWQIWYFPKSGHDWGWISGPGIDNNGAIFFYFLYCVGAHSQFSIVRRTSLKKYLRTTAF